MNIRLLAATPLLLALAIPAQVAGKPAPKPQEPNGPPLVTPAQGVAPTQEPQAPAKPKTPAEELAELRAERTRLEQEIGYARERAQHATSLLAQKLAARNQAFRSIDAGQSATARPMAAQGPRRYARIATPDEMTGRPDGTILVVNGREITEGQFEQVMNYLRQSPSSPDESLRAQRALFDLIRIEAIAAAFTESEGEVHVGEVLGELQAGTDFAAIAQKRGSVQGAKEDGSIEVPRNCIYGPLFEQIAFTTEPGGVTRPFRNASGFVVLKVDGIEKGTTPQLDKVLCHAIQIPYTSDPGALQKAQFAINAGQVDMLVRDQAILDMLPALFKPPVVRPVAPPNTREAVQQQIDQMNAQIARLETADTPPEVLETLRKERARLEEQLKSMPETPKQDADGDGAAAEGADVSKPPTKPAARPPVKPGGSPNGG